MSNKDTSRWELYAPVSATVAAGWTLTEVVAPSRLFGANGMTWGPDGRLWITQFNGEQITTWDRDTDELEIASAMGAPVQGPDDIVFDASGAWYVTETLNGRVTGRRADGEHVVVLDDCPGANGITVDPRTDTLYVDEMREGGRVLRLDTTGAGEHEVLAEGLSWCNALEMSPTGELCLPQVFAGTILALDPETREIRLLVEDLVTPTAVKFHQDGRLVVSEAGKGVVTAIDLETGERTTLADTGPGIDNFVFDPEGNLHVSNFCEARVETYDASGALVASVSSGGLMGPYQVSADADGRLFAADANTLVALEDDGLRRITRLLLDQDYVAVGVACVGDSLLVLSLAGDVFLRRTDGTMTSVVSGTADATAKILSTAMAAASAVGADGTTGLVALADGSLVTVDLDGGLGEPLQTGLAHVTAVAHAGGVVAACDEAAGELVVITDAGPTKVGGLAAPQAVAVAADGVYVVEVGARRVSHVDSSGTVSVVAEGLPVGMPVAAVKHDRRCSIAALPDGSLALGCDGDGSVRRLARA